MNIGDRLQTPGRGLTELEVGRGRREEGDGTGLICPSPQEGRDGPQDPRDHRGDGEESERGAADWTGGLLSSLLRRAPRAA